MRQTFFQSLFADHLQSSRESGREALSLHRNPIRSV